MRTGSAHRALGLDPLTPSPVGHIPSHLNITLSYYPVVDPASEGVAGKPTIHVGLPLGQPDAHPDQALDDAKHDDRTDGDAHDVSGGDGGALGLDVEEGVGIKVFGVIGDIGQRQVEGEDEDDPPGVDPQGYGGTGDDDLEEGEDAVEAMLGGVAKGIKLVLEPGARVDEPPVDGGDDERVDDDGGVVEGVEGLEGSWEAVEEGRARPSVGKRVDG